MLRPINSEENLIKYKGLEWKNNIIKDTLALYPDCTYIGLFGSYFRGDWYEGDVLVEERLERFKNNQNKLYNISDIDLAIKTELPIIRDYKNYQYSQSWHIWNPKFTIYTK